MSRDPALSKAIEAVGNKSVLARHLGLTPQAIDQWRKVPAERVLQVERASGVSRHLLRPDLYPVEEAARVA
jgi:DNA-binding transcriptional regulator YdaS (Cro superfamily)